MDATCLSLERRGLRVTFRFEMMIVVSGDHERGSNSDPASCSSLGEVMPRGEEMVSLGGVALLEDGLICPVELLMVGTDEEDADETMPPDDKEEATDTAESEATTLTSRAAVLERRSCMIFERTSTLFMRRMLK